MLRDLMEVSNTDVESANNKIYLYKALKGFPIVINDNIGFLILSRNINADKLYKDLSPIMEEDFNYTVFKVKASSKRNKGSLFIEVSSPTYKDKNVKTVGIFIFFGPRYLFSDYEIYGYIIPFIPINKDTSSIMLKKYMKEGLFFRETSFLLTVFEYELDDLYYYSENEICIALNGSVPLYFVIYYEEAIKKFFTNGDPYNDDLYSYIYVNSFTGKNNEDKDQLRYDFTRTNLSKLHIFESKKMDYSLDGSIFDKYFDFSFEKEKIKKEKLKKKYNKETIDQLRINLSNLLENSDLNHFKKKINTDSVNVMELLCYESINFALLNKIKVLYVPNYALHGFIITLSHFNELSGDMILMLYKVYLLMVNLFDVNVNIVEIREETKNHTKTKDIYIDEFLTQKNLYIGRVLTSFSLYEYEKDNSEKLSYKFSAMTFESFKSILIESFKNKRFFGLYISSFTPCTIPFKLNTGESIFSVCYHEDDLNLSFENRDFILEKEGGIINENFTFEENDISISQFVSLFPLFLQMMRLQSEKFAYYANAYHKENEPPARLSDFNYLYNNIMEYAWIKSIKALFEKRTSCKIDYDINIMNFNNELFTDEVNNNINYLISNNSLSISYPKITLAIINNSFLGFFVSCYNYNSYMDVYSSMNFINILKDQGYSVFPMKHQNLWKKKNCFYVGDNSELEYFKEHKNFDYIHKYFVLLPDVICGYFNQKPFVSGTDLSKIYVDEMIETTYVIGFDTVMITGGVKSFIGESDFEELSQMYETKIDSRWFLCHKEKIIEEIKKEFSKMI